MSMPMVISLVVALGAACFAVAAFAFYREYAGSRNLDQRLDRLTGQATPTLEQAGILREPLMGEAKGFVEHYLPHLPNVQKLFEQAGLKLQPSQFWLITLGLIGIGGITPALIRMPIWLGLAFGPIFGVLPITFVIFKRKFRLAKFGAQLCEALELVARALRAGHSLAAAMHTVAEEMPEPISKEFGRVYEEQNLGLSIEQAMRNLAERVPNLDLKFFVTAVIIQRTTGGDLAEILDKIGYLIRERFKILGMVKALTGEGRISGVILIALPFVLLVVMMKLNYEYISLLWTDKRGHYMAAGALVSMTIGALVIRKIVNIKV